MNPPLVCEDVPGEGEPRELGLIVVSAIARVSIVDVSPPLLPYLATMMATVLLIAFWP